MDINDSNFKEEVLDSDLPVLADFWAVWCGPCLRLAPVLEELAGQYRNELKFCKVNVDEAPGSAGEYEIMNVPTLMIFKQGKVLNRIIGAPPKVELEKIIKKHI